MTWFGGSGRESLKPQCLKGPLPVGLIDGCGHSVSAASQPNITAYSESSGRDVTARGVFKEAGGRG